MAEPQIEIRTIPLEPGQRRVLVGWYCEWKGQDYGNAVTTALLDDAKGLATAEATALADGEATMRQVTDAES